jgi:hypothetical protein
LSERRKHPRTPCDVRIRWQRVHVEHDEPGHLVATGPVEVALGRNLSRGGLAFVASVELEKGTALLVSLERSEGGPPLSALGRVARCEREDLGFLVGVELTWIECTMPEQALGLQPENAWTLL